MTTYITFVLDETGSMESIKDEAIRGFNKYIETLQKDLKGRTNFSLLLFDTMHQTWRVDGESIKKVQPLNEDTYGPGAATPLWDAVGNAIERTKERVKGKKNPTIIFSVLTDGEENSSHEFTAEQVKEMIEELDDWAFNFVGVGIDAWAMSNQLGVADASASYSDRLDLANSMGVMAGQTVAYATSPAQQQRAMRNNFYRGAKNLADLNEDEDE